MALTIHEAEQCYSALAESAKQNGLDWVLEQTESQIALGKVRSGKIRAKEVPLGSASSEDVLRLSKGRPIQFTISEEFTPAEKLRILIEALRYAVCGLWEVASAISESMSDNTPGLRELEFAPEGISSKKAFVLNRQEIHSREAAVKRLDDLMHEIEEAI